MRVLVTGGRGFVGINVVRTLAVAGHDVAAADRSEVDGWVRGFLAGLDERVSHVQVDLARHDELRRVLAGQRLDAVIHAAVITATTVAVEVAEARSIVDVNLGGTVEALEAAVEAGVRRFVYISSPSALGDAVTLGLVDESVVPRPRTLYGMTKLASEQLVTRWTELGRVEGVSVRIAQPYGPGERATGARVRTSPIWEWLQLAERGEALPTGPLVRARDWTYIDDTAAGITQLATAASLAHDLYHLGTGEPVSVGDVVRELERVYGPLQRDEAPSGDVLNPNIAGPARPPLDPARFEREFGWKPSTGVEDGMRRYLDWWRDFRGLAYSPARDASADQR